MKKKLTCHCGEFEAEVTIPENGIEKVMRCNCTLCKRKGYIIGVLGENDFKIIKGENVSINDTSLSKREWNELMEAFDLKDKLI